MNPALSERLSTGRLWQAALVAGSAAVLGNLVVFYMVGAAGVPLSIPGPQGAMPLAAVPVAATSFIPALLTALFLWGLSRFAARPIRTFQMVAGVLLLLSLIGPLVLPVAASTKVVLGLMHILAAVVIVTVLSRIAGAN